METKILEWDEHLIKFEYTPLATFKDHRGKDTAITSMFPYDFIIERKLKSYLAFVNWFCKNRETISSLVDLSEFGDMMSHYTDLTEWSTDPREVFIHYAYGSSRGTPIQLCIDYCTPKPPVHLVNVSPEAPGQEPLYSIKYFFKRGLGIEPLEEPTTKWSKKYNYSYEMDSSEFKFFRGDSSVYFGMELEISTKLSCWEMQYIVTDVEPKQEPFFIMKNDGSITGCYNNRVELVTVPCSPKYLRKNWRMFFTKLETLAKAKGNVIDDYFDLNTNLNNGIHIHVSKDSFADEIHMNKFLQVWHQRDEDSRMLFNRMSRRRGFFADNQYCQYSYRYNAMKFSQKMKLAKRHRTGIDGRYCVSHDRSRNTVEVRLFQGIFDLKHIFQCISFTESVFEFTWGHGFTSFGNNFVKKYLDFINKNHKYKTVKELAQCV